MKTDRTKHPACRHCGRTLRRSGTDPMKRAVWIHKHSGKLECAPPFHRHVAEPRPIAGPQPVVATIDAGREEVDCGSPPEDLEPTATAYEESMARRTGATVEQLRKEQADAGSAGSKFCWKAGDVIQTPMAEYAGLSDCEICILESLKVDDPAPTAKLVERVRAYNAMAGIPRPQWFGPKEVQHAVERLDRMGRIAWMKERGGYVAVAQGELSLNT